MFVFLFNCILCIISPLFICMAFNIYWFFSFAHKYIICIYFK